MTLLIFLILAVAGSALIAWAYLGSQKNRKKVLPPPRSKRTEVTYQQSNSIAKLFVAASSLDNQDVTWVYAFKALNPEDNPQMRTLLLELRQTNPIGPRQSLEAIKEVCIEARNQERSPSVIELLDEALTRICHSLPNSAHARSAHSDA